MKQGHEYTVQELLDLIEQNKCDLMMDHNAHMTASLAASLALCTAELVKRLYAKEQS